VESELFQEIKDPKKKLFLKRFAESGNLTRSADEIKVGRWCIWNWRRQDDQFREAYDAAEEIFRFSYVNELERELQKRATTVDAPMSTVALFFALKGELPDKYREKAPDYHLPTKITLELAVPPYAKNAEEFEEISRKLLAEHAETETGTENRAEDTDNL